MADTGMVSIQSFAIVATITTFLTAGALIAIVLVSIYLYRALTAKPKTPLPPYSKGSMFENMAATQVQKTLYQLDRDRGFFHDIKPSDLGGSSTGAVFRMCVPTVEPIFFVSDYKLAKLILSGDAKTNVKECEKARVMENMNLTGAEHTSLLTYPTSNVDRDEARKNAAQAFSTSNLSRTWPSLKGLISHQFDTFRKLSTSGETFEAREMFDHFIMGTISRAAYGVAFTDDGTEDEDTINGLEVLEAFDSCSREAARRIMFPLRKYMFWDKDVIHDKIALQRLHQKAEKLERLQNEKNARDIAITGEEKKPFSVLDHLIAHCYKSPETRLADIITFAYAGIDTTATALNHFMMEMARQPHIRAKLQYELSEFMPENRCDEDLMHSSSFNDRALLSSIANCEYLNWCWKESMRLWPVAGGGPLRDVTEDLEYNGIRLPKGSMVACAFYSMFRERWIDRPDEFIPERWADTNPQLPQLKEMLIPFSLGKRNCMGQNMAMFQLKIITAHFLHYYDFELLNEPTFEFFVTLRSESLLMRVKQRV